MKWAEELGWERKAEIGWSMEGRMSKKKRESAPAVDCTFGVQKEGGGRGVLVLYCR